MSIGFVTRSKGGLLSAVLRQPGVASKVRFIVTDAACGAENVARAYGLEYRQAYGKSNEEISSNIAEYCEWYGPSF